MKFLYYFFAVLVFVSYQNDTCAQQLSSTQRLVVRDVTQPSVDRPISPRSVKPVEAYIYFDFEELEVNFNDDLDKVVVVIQDQTGQEVCSYSCDTNIEPVISLPLPMSEGVYTLRILGDTYEGEGNFDL